MGRSVRIALLVLLLAAPAFGGVGEITKLVKDLGVPRTRVAAYRGLLLRRDARAIPLLVSALPAYDIASQYYGVIVLSRYPRALGDPALRKLTLTGTPALCVTAGAVLFARGGKDVGLPIADALLSGMVTPAVRRVLITRARAVNHPAVQSALRSLLRPTNDGATITLVLDTLHRQGCRAAARDAAKLTGDSRLLVRGQAAAWLHRFGDERCVEVVAEAIRAPQFKSTHWTRLHALLVAADRFPPPLLDALADRIRTEKDVRTLRAAIGLLRGHPHPPAAAALEPHLTHADDLVADAAFAALLEIPAALPPEKLQDLLGSEDEALALRAASALLRMDLRSGLPATLRILREGDAPVRAKAAHLLGAVRRTAVVSPLIDALTDRDEAVREAARSSLEETLTVLFPYRSFHLAPAVYVKGTPLAREKAAVALRVWWKRERSEDW